MERKEVLERLVKGAYDLHMHAAPSPFGRAMDDYGLLQEADAAGMGGIMLKSHYESTAARAQLVNAHAGCTAKAFGGIVLNWPVGGLNPYAAENALIRDARILWMPTRDSANSLLSGNMPGDFFSRPGISVVDEAGSLKPEVVEILNIAKKYNAAVATGHISPEESITLCKAGAAMGVRMILTHPEFDRTVVDAATVAADLLEESGVADIDPERLRQGDSMFVTPKDIDAQVRDLAKVVGYAIDWAVQDLEIEEITALLS